MECDDEAPNENDDKFLEFLNPDFGEVQVRDTGRSPSRRRGPREGA